MRQVAFLSDYFYGCPINMSLSNDGVWGGESPVRSILEDGLFSPLMKFKEPLTVELLEWI